MPGGRILLFLFSDKFSCPVGACALKIHYRAAKADYMIVTAAGFIETDMDTNELRLLVTLAMEKVGGACAAFSEDGEGSYRFVAAYRGEDFAEWRTALCDAIHGHGGGKAPFIQGKASCTEDEIRRFFED